MDHEERISKLECDVSELKTGQAETKVYTKMILDSLNKMETKIDNLGELKKKEPFWDADTKRTAIKWGGIIILVILLLVAGRGLFELANIIPK